MRIGRVVKVLPEKKIGFIRSYDLNEDVFFHFSKITAVGRMQLQEGDEVEYEIDELAKIENERLQATLVRRSVRPLEMRIQPSDAPGLRAQHHPKARRQRPKWRSRPETSGESEDE